MGKFTNTHINDCYYYSPSIHTDHRGLFLEAYKASEFANFLPSQTNCSISKKGTLRGIHRTPYAKLVTCVKGKIYDVCIDLRPDSKTYNQYFSIYLDDISFQSLYIPPYC
jgi:dTDP-4-dehydrorhamnose 3,5-epimerase